MRDPETIDESCILHTLKSIGFKVVDEGDANGGQKGSSRQVSIELAEAQTENVSRKAGQIQNAYELLAIYIFQA